MLKLVLTFILFHSYLSVGTVQVFNILGHNIYGGGEQDFRSYITFRHGNQEVSTDADSGSSSPKWTNYHATFDVMGRTLEIFLYRDEYFDSDVLLYHFGLDLETLYEGQQDNFRIDIDGEAYLEMSIIYTPEYSNEPQDRYISKFDPSFDVDHRIARLCRLSCSEPKEFEVLWKDRDADLDTFNKLLTVEEGHQPSTTKGVDYTFIKTESRLITYILREENIVYVIFRPTDSSTNWDTNFNLQLISWEKEKPEMAKHYFKGGLHQGFVNLIMDGKDQIFNAIKKYYKKGDTIISTGMSLGGATATLGAMIIKQQWPDYNVECISFGGPRVGNTEFAKFYQTLGIETRRYVNPLDPVPHTPPVNFMEPFNEGGPDGNSWHHVSPSYITYDGLELAMANHFGYRISAHGIYMGIDFFSAAFFAHVRNAFGES